MNLIHVTRDSLPNLQKRDGHKFTHGHALVLTGGAGQTGAARLAARGALRIGAGLVTLGAPSAAMAEIAAQVTAIMLKPITSVDDLQNVLKDARINALCIGPGFGLHRGRAAFITECLAARRSTVVDADALTLFEDAPHLLFEQLRANCVLTPHGGEFRRLFPDLADQAACAARSGKCTAVAKAAARAGCTILLKGVETVIATEKGDVALHAATAHRAAPWLATAGAGDVLAGFITGLMARGFGPFSAATAAAWVHVECARRFGPGLIAEDLPEQAPAVLAGLCN